MESHVDITQDLSAFRFNAGGSEDQVRGAFESSSLRPAFAQRAAYYGLEEQLIGAMQS